MNTNTLTTDSFHKQIYNQANQAAAELIKEAKLT